MSFFFLFLSLLALVAPLLFISFSISNICIFTWCDSFFIFFIFFVLLISIMFAVLFLDFDFLFLCFFLLLVFFYFGIYGFFTNECSRFRISTQDFYLQTGGTLPGFFVLFVFLFFEVVVLIFNFFRPNIGRKRELL